MHELVSSPAWAEKVDQNDNDEQNEDQRFRWAQRSRCSKPLLRADIDKPKYHTTLPSA